MEELIIVNMESETVSARDLHEKLNIETPFKKWVDRMCEYGFEEGKDFWTNLSESTGGRQATEYDLSVGMAKEICMIQRSPEGKQLRQYFLDLEKAWNTPEQIMARALKLADVTIKNLQLENSIMKPKADFFDAVADSKTAVSMNEVAKVLGIKGLGRNNLFEL